MSGIYNPGFPQSGGTIGGDTVVQGNLTANTFGEESAVKTENFVVDDDAGVYLVDCTLGNVTATLPAAASVAKRYYTFIKQDASANTLILDGNLTETINGALTLTVSYRYSSVTLYSDGTSWLIV